jgi:PAS domain S-box-containing protein
MATEEYDQMRRRCVELERQLEESEKKVRYYQTLAEQAGQARLRETEALSRLLSEHIQVQKTLAKNAENLRQIIDLVPHRIFVKNREGCFLLVNAAVANSLNTTVEDLTGKLHADVHPHPEEIDRMLADDQMVIAGGQSLTIAEEPYTDQDGTLHWLQTVKVPYVTADPSEPAVLGIAIDITERKRIEESLRASEHRFRDLFNNSPDAIFVEDVQGNVLDVNPAACQLHDMTYDELVGKNVLDLVPQEKRDYVKTHFADQLSGKETHIEGLVSLTKDGRIIPVDIRISPLQYDGQAAVLFHVRDITEQKRAEQALRASEQRFRELFENSPDAIFVQDPKGTILDVNRAACILHHMTRDELMGKNAIELVPKGIHGRVIRDFSHMEPGSQVQFEGLSLTKDGEEIPVDIRVSKFTYGGTPAFLLHVRDITERKQSEGELAQYRQHLEELVEARTRELQQQIADRERAEEQLKESLQEKEVLLKEIHHRVKNNLQVISSLLNLQAALLQDEHARTLFRESQHRVKTMALIHEKLYQSNTLREIDFSGYVRSLISEIYTSYQPFDSTVELVVDVMDAHLGIDAAIPCGLVVNELISNALKYAFPQRRGTIRVTFTESSEKWYELVVCDDGIGLPSHIVLDRLNSLGLQLVKGLVEEQLGGVLELERHQGTIWRIRFPSVR